MTRMRTQASLLKSASPEPRSCAAATCYEQVTPGRIFCPNHWFFLPKFLREAIIATFRDEEWEAHGDAIRQGADFIDRETVEAREAGLGRIVTARSADGHIIRYAGRRI